MSSILASSGVNLAFPSWGRSYWQDPNDGELICFYASGINEVDYVTSSDSGVTWSVPAYGFPVDDFGTHNNFDTSMDRAGNVHCVHRFNGSGCYTIFGKVAPSGGWAASGVVARGFFTCRATVAARDFNGSIEVHDAKIGPFDSIAGSLPAARIVAVDNSNGVKSWYVNTPFTAFPTLHLIETATNVGPSGGFPIPLEGGGTGSMIIPISIDATGIIEIHHPSPGGAPQQFFQTVLIDPTVSEALPARIDGFVGDVPLGPNMTWCRPYFAVLNPILTTDNDLGKFELYTTAAESNGNGQFFGRVDSLAVDFVNADTRRLNTDDLTFKDFVNNLAGSSQEMGGGVSVDISYLNEDGVLYFYFQQRKLNGDQTIFRIKAELEAQQSGQGHTIYKFSDISHATSGIVSWADASLKNAGAGASGLDNIVHWNKFKVSRSPVAPGLGMNRVETLATIGHGVTGGSGDLESKLYIWNFDDSLASVSTSQLPTFVTEHTADSGNTFVGINTFSGITDSVNLFDKDVATSGQISNGDSITLEFSDALTFNRLEVLWSSPPSTFLGVDVSASYDDITYNTVLNIPSGILGASPSLVKSSAEYDPVLPSGTFVDADMDSFSAKYVKLDFVGADATARDVREIKLYGANSTKGFISTSGWESILIPPNSRREGFGSTPSGSLPSGWTNTGDWNWFVDVGNHESGVFGGGATGFSTTAVGNTIGTGDLSSMRTARNAPINTSGVVQVDVDITSPRTLRFGVKWDLQGDVPGTINKSDPTDDYLELFIITPTGTIDKSDDIYQTAFLSPRNWFVVSTELNEPGINTIQFVFTRGNKLPGEGSAFAEAAVWIDSVEGLDAADGSPNLLTSLYGFTEGAPLSATGNINSYLASATPEDNRVLAYMLPTFGIPSGIINAYIGPTEFTEIVYGYMSALHEYNDFNSYMEGFIDTPAEVVNSYIFTSGAFDLLYGHMQNRLNESINGFLLAPSGAFDTINAYIATPQFIAVNGYMRVTEDETIEVNAYLKADGFGDRVNGYMLASGLIHQSYAYVNTDGAVDSFNAYMRATQQMDAAGYINGHSEISGVINSWISGVAMVSGITNAYMPVISGSITGVFNGFISALQSPDGSINGHLIGFDPSGGSCDFPVPLPPFVSSPTGNFFS